MSYAGINATVLQKNNQQFYCDPCGDYGITMNIPCGSAAAEADPAIRWAVPVKTDYVQGWAYEIADTQPTYDSIRVFKLTNIINGDWYVVVGTQEAYQVACAACCDASPIPTIVTTERLSYTSDEYLCDDGSGNFDGFWAVQPLTGSERYVSVVSINGTKLSPVQTYATGSTSIANLITYLNTNYGVHGVWSIAPSPYGIRLRATAETWVGFVACNKTS